MKKTITKNLALLLLFVAPAAILVNGCSDMSDMEPIDFDPNKKVTIEDVLSTDGDPGDTGVVVGGDGEN